MIKNFSKKKRGKNEEIWGRGGEKNIQSRKHLYAFLHKRAYYLEKHFLCISRGHTDKNVFERQREIFPIFRDACGNEFSNFSCIFNVFAWIHQNPWFPKYNGNCSSNIRAKRVSISLQDLYELFTSFSVEK